MLAHRLVSYQGAVFAAALPQDQAASQAASNGSHLPSAAPDAETPALTVEQINAMFGAAPEVGQEVGLFEIGRMTDG
jgi:hypothetical protein